MPSDAAALVAQAIAAGTGDPRRAAERLLAAADRDQARLERAASLLIQRLKLRSNDFEATLSLRIVERALAGVGERAGEGPSPVDLASSGGRSPSGRSGHPGPGRFRQGGGVGLTPGTEGDLPRSSTSNAACGVRHAACGRALSLDAECLATRSSAARLE
jgi:hypothetical protein